MKLSVRFSIPRSLADRRPTVSTIGTLTMPTWGYAALLGCSGLSISPSERQRRNTTNRDGSERRHENSVAGQRQAPVLGAGDEASWTPEFTTADQLREALAFPERRDGEDGNRKYSDRL